MSWSSNSPDVTKSVSTNGAPMLANTVYTETKMNIDHFWNIGDDEDGHHKFAQMPKYEDGAVATPTSPTIAAGMDLAYFARLKTATEAVANQDVQPYARNASAIMQLLGIRACVVFNGAGVIAYSHNVRSVTGAAGAYVITYDSALPSADYLVLGGAIRNSATGRLSLIAGVDASTSLPGNKTTALCNVHTTTVNQDLSEPTQAWFVMFGG